MYLLVQVIVFPFTSTCGTCKGFGRIIKVGMKKKRMSISLIFFWFYTECYHNARTIAWYAKDQGLLMV